MSYDAIGRGFMGFVTLITTIAAVGFTIATPFLWWLAISMWRAK